MHSRVVDLDTQVICNQGLNTCAWLSGSTHEPSPNSYSVLTMAVTLTSGAAVKTPAWLTRPYTGTSPHFVRCFDPGCDCTVTGGAAAVHGCADAGAAGVVQQCAPSSYLPFRRSMCVCVCVRVRVRLCVGVLYSARVFSQRLATRESCVCVCVSIHSSGAGVIQQCSPTSERPP